MLRSNISRAHQIAEWRIKSEVNRVISEKQFWVYKGTRYDTFDHSPIQYNDDLIHGFFTLDAAKDALKDYMDKNPEYTYGYVMHNNEKVWETLYKQKQEL